MRLLNPILLVVLHLSLLIVDTGEWPLPCVDPINFIMSTVNTPRSLLSLSIFVDDPGTLFLQHLIAKIKMVTPEHLPLVVFEQLDKLGKYFEKNSNYAPETNGAIVIIPQSEKSAENIFNQVAKLENGAKFYIVWPTTENLANKILTSNFTLPSIATQVYILHCPLNFLNDVTIKVNWNLYTIYSLGQENLTRLTQVAFNDTKSLFQQRRDFQGATIMAALPRSRSSHGWSIQFKFENRRIVIKSGPVGHVALFLQDSLNLRFNFKFTTGKFQTDGQGNWSDMARYLLEDQVDIALVPETFLPTRAGHVTFLTPHVVEGVMGYFQQPPPSSIRNIYIESFPRDVWLSMVTVWVVIYLAMVVAGRFKLLIENQSFLRDKVICDNPGLWTIGLISQQGWHLTPQSVTIRIIFLTSSMMALLLYLAYNAALVSTLSMDVVSIKQLSDLLKTDFYVTFQPNSKTVEMLIRSQVYPEIRLDHVTRLQQKEKKISKAIEGVTMVFKGGVAYFSFSNSFYVEAKGPLKQADWQLCDKISSIPLSKVPFRSGMLAPKNSQYRDFFNQRLSALFEYGLMKRIQRNSQGLQAACDKLRRGPKGGVGLEMMDLITSYFVIISGICLSAFILLIEILHFQRKTARWIKKCQDLSPLTVTTIKKMPGAK